MSDTYESGYAKSRMRFAAETAEHRMEVLRDDDLLGREPAVVSPAHEKGALL